MCRLLVVKSVVPVSLADLTTRPNRKSDSIIAQASDCRLRLDGGPINADGFGIGWYDPTSPINTPCIFQAITPAWSNRNLHRIAEKVRSPLVYAHVRASTTGSLSEENCHPFNYGCLLWMHNGGVADFQHKIKRKLQNALSDDLYSFPSGSTDSEWAFALFLQLLSGLVPDLNASSFSYSVLKQAMLQTIAMLNKFSKEAGVTEPSLLNFVVTDGHAVIATRYISSKTDEAASLYFSTGTSFEEVPAGSGTYRMQKYDKRESIILIASEPLTFEKADWLEISSQTLIVITPKMNLLQMPIVDEYFQNTVHPQRDRNFAASKGFSYSGSTKLRNTLVHVAS